MQCSEKGVIGTQSYQSEALQATGTTGNHKRNWFAQGTFLKAFSVTARVLSQVLKTSWHTTGITEEHVYRGACLSFELCRSAHGLEGAFITDALPANRALFYGLAMLRAADAQRGSHEEVDRNRGEERSQ